MFPFPITSGEAQPAPTSDAMKLMAEQSAMKAKAEKAGRLAKEHFGGRIGFVLAEECSQGSKFTWLVNEHSKWYGLVEELLELLDVEEKTA